MNRQKWILLCVTLALIGSAGGVLARLHSHQNLGKPGVKTSAIPNSIRLRVDLPETVLDYTSQWREADQLTLDVLPADTSFGCRRYMAADQQSWIDLSVVLMGSDRTSLHKPQFCLEGMGLHIDENSATEDLIHIERPMAYDLRVIKLVSTGRFMQDGQPQTFRGVYVYWYVADEALSASVSGAGRMWSLATHFLRTGVLQRWAYVSCFAVCVPGQEEATYQQMKRFIAAAVPEFQLTPHPGSDAVVSR
jgi:hypothetical protein